MSAPVPSLPEGVKDPYALLGVNNQASDKDIRRAYRKKARDIHPDKNPDDPNAEVNFHRLQEVYEFLIHKEARGIYDEALRKREQWKARYAQVDATRRRFAEELERREKDPRKGAGEVDRAATGSSRVPAQSDEHHAAREATEKWIAQKQQQKREELKKTSSFSSADPKNTSKLGFVEVSWTPRPLIPGAMHTEVSEGSLLFSFSRFGAPRMMTYDGSLGKCIIALDTREEALEAALHFIKNKEKYAFTVKFMKRAFAVSDPLEKVESASEKNKNQSPAPSTDNDSVPSSTTSLSAFEASVMDRLKEAAKRQKMSA